MADQTQTLVDMVHHSVREIMIAHAKNCGATEEWINSLSDLDSSKVFSRIFELYGVPPA